MVGGIDHGHLCTTVVVVAESCKMAAILQLIGWQRMQPWFIASFFDIGNPCYGQLTSVKTRHLLTGVTWTYCELKFITHQDDIFWSLPLTKCWFSIGLRAHAKLICCNQGCVVQKPGNANPGWKAIWSCINFLCRQMFFTAFVSCSLRLFKRKMKNKTMYRKSRCKVSKFKSKFLAILG